MGIISKINKFIKDHDSLLTEAEFLAISTLPQKIKRTEIIKESQVCPYCLRDVKDDQSGCCGESSSHFTDAYITKAGAFLADEVVILEGE